MNNSSIQATTKAKLLRYQNECESSTRKLLGEERDKLAEYLDKQTTVVTKENR